MVRDTKPPLGDVKADAQRAVEQTMEQARWAVDNYFNFVQKIISSYPSGGDVYKRQMSLLASTPVKAEPVNCEP